MLVIQGCSTCRVTSHSIANDHHETQIVNFVSFVMMPTGVTALFDALESSRSLASLTLAGCCLSSEGTRILAHYLSSSNCRLQALNISYNDLGQIGAVHIAHAVAANKSLRSLNLRGNSMGDAGGLALATGLLANCGVLTELIVADNGFSQATAVRLAACMRGGAGMHVLCIYECMCHRFTFVSVVHLCVV